MIAFALATSMASNALAQDAEIDKETALTCFALVSMSAEMAKANGQTPPAASYLRWDSLLKWKFKVSDDEVVKFMADLDKKYSNFADKNEEDAAAKELARILSFCGEYERENMISYDDDY